MSTRTSFASLVMRRATYKLLKNQLLIVLLVATLSIIFFDLAILYACLYGGFIAIAGTLISSWRITRAGSTGKHQGYIEIYLGAIQKYILTLVLFAIGIGALHLSAVAMIVTFSMEQFAYLFINVDTRNKITNHNGATP